MSNTLKTALIAAISAICYVLTLWVGEVGTGEAVEAPTATTQVTDTVIVDTLTTVTAGTTDTLPTKTLGVNFTWSQIQQINSQRKGHEAWRNYTADQLSWVQEARFFVYMSKDFDEEEKGKNLKAIQNLRRLMPNATIWLTFESSDQGKWPLKCYPVEWWGNNPRAKAKTYFDQYFAGCRNIGGPFVFQATNEEHPHVGSDRQRVYDLVRMGIVDSHKEYTNAGGSLILLGTGNREYENRTYTINSVKAPISQSILDLEDQYLDYINSTKGWTDYHIYPDEGEFYVHPDDLDGNHKWEDFKTFIKHVRTTYPDMKIAAGETTNLRAAHGERLSKDEKRASFPRLRKHIDKCYKVGVDAVILYQIENHSRPEGQFSDSGVLTWIDSLKAYRTTLN